MAKPKPKLPKQAPPVSMPAHNTHLAWLLVGAIVLAHIALGVYKLDAESMWGDEQNSVRIARMDLLRIAKGQDATHPPGYHVLLYVWVRIFGDSDFSARLFSVLGGAAAIIAVFLLGKELFGEWVGVIAGLLMGFSSYLLYYSQEARPYTFVVLLAALSTYYLVRVLERDRLDREAIFYILLASAGMYIHYFFIFVVAMHGSYALALVLLDQKELFAKLKRIIALFVPVGLLYVPWGLIKFAPRFLPSAPRASYIGWIATPTPQTVTDTFGEFLGVFSWRLPWWVVWVVMVVAVLLALLPFFRSIKRIAIEPLLEHRHALLVVGSFLGPLVVAYVFSQSKPIWVPRYLILVLPFMWLTIALAISRLRFKAVMGIIMAVLLIVNVAGVKQMYDDQTKEDWRAAVRFLSKEYQQGDLIIRYNIPEFPLTYYMPKGAGWQIEYMFPIEGAGVETTKLDLESKLKGRYRVHIIYTFYDTNRPAVLDRFVDGVDGWKRVSRKEFTHILVDTYEHPLLLDGKPLDPQAIVYVPSTLFSGSIVEPFEGLIPFYSTGDYGAARTDVKPGKHLVMFELKGDNPPPLLIDYSFNEARGVIRRDDDLTNFTTIAIPLTTEVAALRLKFTFFNDTYKEVDGRVVADNAAFIKNVRIVKVGDLD